MCRSGRAGRRLCDRRRCRCPGQLAPVAHQLGYDGLGMEGVVGEEGGGAGVVEGVMPCLAEVVAAVRGGAVVDEHGAADVDHAGEGGAGAYVVADGFHAAKVRCFAARALRIWGGVPITRIFCRQGYAGGRWWDNSYKSYNSYNSYKSYKGA